MISLRFLLTENWFHFFPLQQKPKHSFVIINLHSSLSYMYTNSLKKPYHLLEFYIKHIITAGIIKQHPIHQFHKESHLNVHFHYQLTKGD